MSGGIALDTNVLAYAEGVNGTDPKETVLELLARLPRSSLVVPVQVLGEFFNVLTRKDGRAPDAARAVVIGWRDSVALADTSPDVVVAALDLSTAHRLQIWDAVILCAASSAGCRVLLSEDLQHGFTWGGVTVVDPFRDPPHPLLQAALTSA